MTYEAKITGYDGVELKLVPLRSIERDLINKNIHLVELRLSDGREISNEQRKKIFAIIRDIALWSGHDPEYLRQYMTWDFCGQNNHEWFSLSNVDMSTAREFITHLITFCFDWDVLTKDTLLTQTEDIGKYLYLCLEHRKCAICNRYAEVHHVNRIGMGADREKAVHVGLKAIALCHEHRIEAHSREKALFDENHIYGIALDEYLCKCLNLRRKKKAR